MKIKFLDLERQYETIKQEIEPAVLAVMDSQIFINGPIVKEFEEKFADFCGTKYAVGCSSGTDALLMALIGYDIGPGDEVITTPFTFFATVETIIRGGAKPVFVDIDEKTFNIKTSSIEAQITEKTKAIMPVHIFGQCCNMDEIVLLARKYNLRVIEDAAQAVGAHWKNDKAGSMGDAGCFSFFPSKNLGGFGDGGIVTTNDTKLYNKLLTTRQHGIDMNKPYFYSHIGGNFRLDAIQASVLNIKLKYITHWQEKRRQNAYFYNKLFKKVVVPSEDINVYHVYNQYVIKHSQRDIIKNNLINKKIGCAIYYPLPLHLQPCIKFLGYKEGDFPVCESACEQVLALPIYPEVTEEEQRIIVSGVEEIL